MYWQIAKVIISAVLIAATSTLAQKQPRLGALLLSLPIVSLLAFGFTWVEHRDLATISRLARETLILVPLGLPFFVPLAFSKQLGLSFWPCFGLGIVLASATIGAWLRFGPATT
ncbi:hypothetical protein [Adhaeretor mobilis]|uniref:DUF3147 family protein n=1 Tax=Adhaeretor mobilis TaxID=1930276 RepID=A0A517MU85_9BACT|nr:hypothetical protein [Adhaeretor mobilis]QDS98347.1 hypothetical protein HG15A2_16200 [Adhaeretor mobilis]